MKTHGADNSLYGGAAVLPGITLFTALKYNDIIAIHCFVAEDSNDIMEKLLLRKIAI